MIFYNNNNNGKFISSWLDKRTNLKSIVPYSYSLVLSLMSTCTGCELQKLYLGDMEYSINVIIEDIWKTTLLHFRNNLLNWLFETPQLRRFRSFKKRFLKHITSSLWRFSRTPTLSKYDQITKNSGEETAFSHYLEKSLIDSMGDSIQWGNTYLKMKK